MKIFLISMCFLAAPLFADPHLPEEPIYTIDEDDNNIYLHVKVDSGLKFDEKYSYSTNESEVVVWNECKPVNEDSFTNKDGLKFEKLDFKFVFCNKEDKSLFFKYEEKVRYSSGGFFSKHNSLSKTITTKLKEIEVDTKTPPKATFQTNQHNKQTITFAKKHKVNT